jgi:hypothetical protein
MTRASSWLFLKGMFRIRCSTRLTNALSKKLDNRRLLIDCA